MLDLVNTSVFVDFDGTISTADVAQHVLERHGAPAWRDLAAAYDRGVIGSRECTVDQWALVDATEAELRATASEVPLDPGFDALVATLREAGAEVTVVSDGFGFYVEPACAPFGVDVPYERFATLADVTVRVR